MTSPLVESYTSIVPVPLDAHPRAVDVDLVVLRHGAHRRPHRDRPDIGGLSPGRPDRSVPFRRSHGRRRLASRPPVRSPRSATSSSPTTCPTWPAIGGPRWWPSPAGASPALPSPMRIGVGVVAVAVAGAGRLVGGGRVVRLLAARPLPVLGEYVRLVRSLGYAYVWETWPATTPTGGVGDQRRAAPVTGRHAGPDDRPDGRGARRRLRRRRRADRGAARRGRLRRHDPRGRGRLVRQGEVVPFSLEQMDRQYRAGGVTAALGLPSIAYTEGCCAGGGTEVNSGLYRRPPEEVLERWRRDAPRRRPRPRRRRRRSATRSSVSCPCRPVPGDQIAGQRGAASRRGRARLAPRRDPTLDDLSRRPRRPPRAGARA